MKWCGIQIPRFLAVCLKREGMNREEKRNDGMKGAMEGKWEKGGRGRKGGKEE